LSISFLFITRLSVGYAQIDDTPDKPSEMAPATPGVKPVIPLNKDDPTYNLWKKI
jgi:hypothetical protein